MFNSYFKFHEHKTFVAELVFSCSVITVSVVEFWKACEVLTSFRIVIFLKEAWQYKEYTLQLMAKHV